MALAKVIRKHVEATDIKKEQIAKLVGVDPSRISQMLGSVPSNDEVMYRKILDICWYPRNLFDDLVAEIKIMEVKEHYPEAFDRECTKVAFSSKTGGKYTDEQYVEAQKYLEMRFGKNGK